MDSAQGHDMEIFGNLRKIRKISEIKNLYLGYLTFFFENSRLISDFFTSIHISTFTIWKIVAEIILFNMYNVYKMIKVVGR